MRLLTVLVVLLAAAPVVAAEDGGRPALNRPASHRLALNRLALNRLAGPVPAEVIRVIDGDTLAVRAHIWLGQEVETLVRLFGVDAPELKGKCPAERDAAQRARQALSDKVAGGAVALRDIRFEKYAGRVMSRIEANGADVGRALIADGVVRSYWGRKREGWCGD